MTSGSENGETQDLWAWARDPDDHVETADHTRPKEEDWEWAHRAVAPRTPDIPVSAVAAIIVVHNAADWLDRTLRAVAALESRPGLLVAVETGSVDRSAMLLDEALREGVLDQVITAGEVPGFGAAVNLAVDQLGDEYGWLWLLHDDAEPHPDALDALLLRASEEDGPDVLFPKLLQPRRRNHPDQLSEIGSSITRGASRHLSVSPGEIDQRQSVSGRVLGGSTAGMLVRRRVWADLDGLDPDLPLFRDGQDFGWRANAAGHVVVTAPDAALHHRQEGRFGERASTLTRDASSTDRLLGMRLLAAHSDKPGPTIARLRVNSVLRSVGYLLGKAPSEAMAEFRAATRIGGDRATIRAMRERRRDGGADVGPLLPARGAVWASRIDRLTHHGGEWRGRDEQTGTSLDDLTGDDFTGGRRSNRLVTPGRVLALVVVVGFLIAWRRMWGRGQLTSAQLTPAPDSLTAAWAAWLHPVAGEAGANPGWLGLSAIGSTLSGGSPELFARLLVLGAPLLGAALAHRLVRRIVGPGWVAVAFAAVWPALAILSGVTGRGSISGALLVILLPLAGVAGLRWFTQADADAPAADHLRAPASLALWMGLAAQGAPMAALVSLGAAIAWVLLHRRFTPGVLVAGLGPVLMLVPWAPRLLQHPGRFLTGSDPTAAPPVSASPAWHVLLGRGTLDGLPPLALSLAALVGMAVVTVLAVLLGRRRLSPGVVASISGAASLSLVLAAWLTRLLVDVDGQQVRPSVDLWLLLSGGLVLVLALLSMRPVGQVRPRDEVTAGTLAATIAATVVALLGMGWAIGGQSSSPLQVRPDPLPAYVADVQNSSRATRTLLIQAANGSHRWTLTSRGAPGWGSGEAFPVLASVEEADHLAGLAARVAGGTPGDDLAQQLSEYGIAHVVLRGGSPETIQGVSNAPGLTAATLEDTSVTVWTVQGLISRAAMRPAAGGLNPLPGAEVDQPGILRIAEVPDDRWIVEVGGETLPVSDDASGFGIIADASSRSGPLAWSTRATWGALVVHLVVLSLLLVLAAPTARRPGARPPIRSLDTPRRSL